MLKVMRDSFQQLKWVLVFVIFVFVVFIFVDWGRGGAGGSSAGSAAYAARVNGEIIPARDFDRAVYFTEQSYEQMYGKNLSPDMLKALNIPAQVMSSLIDRKLLLQQADELDLTATQEEVRKKILDLPALNPDGKFVGPELYKRYVTASLGYSSPAAFEQEVKEELTLQKLESALANSVVVSPEWARDEYKRRNENAKIQYVLYPIDRLAGQVSVTPAELSAWYEQHKAEYSHPEQRKVKYLLADLAQIRSQSNVDEARLRQQYEASKDSFQTGESVRASHILIKTDANATPAEDAAAKAKAEGILAKLKAGGDFAALARANSGDPGSAARGGDLGFFGKGQMVPEFDERAFSLPVGQLSDVFKTQFGYHILKVTDKRPAGVKPFEEVRDQLEGQLRNEQAAEIAHDRIAQVRARIQQSQPKNDQDFRALTGDTVSYNDSGWFTKGQPIAGVGPNAELSSWAFAAKKGDVGPLIETQRGPMVPVLADVRPPGVPPLDEIQQQVESDVKQSKARQMSTQALATAMQGKTIEQLAASVGVDPKEATVQRMTGVAGLTGDKQGLVNAALGANPGEIKGPVAVDQGAVAFKVLDVKRFDPAAYATEKDGFITAMRQNEARKLRAALLEKLKKNAQIVTNEDLVQSHSGKEPAA